MDFRSRFKKKGRKKKKKSSSALGRRRKRVFKIKVTLVIFFAIVLVVFISWTLRLPEVSINKSVINGNNLTPTEEIESIIDKYLSGEYLWLIPRKNSFFYPRKNIEREISEAFPRVKLVEIHRRDFTALIVNIEEREPFALWCGEQVAGGDENLNHCYFMDKLSYIYASAPNFTGNIFFKYFGKTEGESLYKKMKPIGTTYMKESDFLNIRPFIEAFEELGYVPVSLVNVDGKDFELYMDDGMKVIFGADIKLSILLDNMESILDSDSFREGEGKPIEYIDLRFGNKVYRKFKEEEKIIKPLPEKEKIE